MQYGFGIDIGGTSIKVAFFDRAGTLLKKWELPTNTEVAGERILSEIAASVDAFLQREGIAKEEILGIGVGVPGPVDDEGIVNHCVNIGWGQKNLPKELSELTGFRVRAGNDANVAALGEYRKGSGTGCQTMILVTFGTGVGGGIVEKGKLLHGAHGAGGEIGHMKINPKEALPCNCGGHGCAEQYCSATGVVRLAKQYLQMHPQESVLCNLQTLEAKDVFSAAKAGDAAANAILEQVYAYIGLLLANLCCVVDPERIVLGGGMSRAGIPFLTGVEAYFQKYAFYGCASTKLALATLGNDAGMYGAFQLLFEPEDTKDGSVV